MLEKLKLFLNIKDNLQDELLQEIINIYSFLLKQEIQKEEIPSELEFIVIEMSIKRFNSIGDEGLSKKSLEGLSLEYNSNSLNEYKEIIEKYIQLNKDPEESKNNSNVRFF